MTTTASAGAVRAFGFLYRPQPLPSRPDHPLQGGFLPHRSRERQLQGDPQSRPHGGLCRDRNNQEIARLKHRTNDYGSFDGAYCPRDRLMGRMLHPNRGREFPVTVEEYKRPKFQVTVDALAEPATNGKVKVRGSAMAYTGASNNNVLKLAPRGWAGALSSLVALALLVETLPVFACSGNRSWYGPDRCGRFLRGRVRGQARSLGSREGRTHFQLYRLRST